MTVITTAGSRHMGSGSCPSYRRAALRTTLAFSYGETRVRDLAADDAVPADRAVARV